MFLRSNLPGIGWGLLILLFCGLPGEEIPDPSFFDLSYFDGAVHLFLFLVLSFLLGIGFKKQYRYPLLKAHTKKAVFLIGTIYGLLIESLQYSIFVDRYFETSDLIANAIGAGAGALLFLGIYGRELA